MDTFTGAKPVESESGAGRDSPAGLVGAGISLNVVVGLIYLIDAPEDLEEGSYLGFLFLANFLGALVAAPESTGETGGAGLSGSSSPEGRSRGT